MANQPNIRPFQAMGSSEEIIKANELASMPPMGRLARLALAAALICQVPLLIAAARANRHLLNQDAISFLRFARYYASWRLDLAVCGVFGPLVSWLIAPLLRVVDDPLVAARIVMGLSAVVFLVGTIRLLGSLRLEAAWVILGAWAAAFGTVYWSVRVITPDLLYCGIIFLAVAEMVSRRWVDEWKWALLSGMLAGLSYLAKPVGFPTSLALIGVIALLWIVSGSANRRAVFRSVRFALVGFALFATPWVIALSAKYHGPTIYTGWQIAHAVVGPPDMDRYYPVMLRRPEPGRIAWFEDNTEMVPAFETRMWSPFQSWYYARHQMRVIYTNLSTIGAFLGAFDSLHIGLAAVLLGFFVHAPWRDDLRAGRWRWSGAIVGCLSCIYLPGWAGEARYHLVTYPFLFAASAGIVTFLTANAPRGLNVPRLIGFGLVAFSFLNANRPDMTMALHGLQDEVSSYAADLSGRLRAGGISGPIAGAGDYKDPWTGEFLAYYVAFLLDQQYYGSDPEPTPGHYRSIGADVVVVNRRAPVVAELSRDPGFIDLDSVLFRTREEAEQYPVRLFRQVSR